MVINVKKLIALSVIIIGALLLANSKNSFKPEYASYRIFEGETVIEHNVDNAYGGYYNDSFYNQLSPNEKSIYKSVAMCGYDRQSAVALLPEPVLFYSDTSEPKAEELEGVGVYLSQSYQRALDALFMDGDDAFYIRMGEGGTTFSYEYASVFQEEGFLWCIDRIKTDIKVKECYANPLSYREKVSHAVADFTPRGDTRYQRVKSIHDYIVNRVRYEETPCSHDAYGALVEGRATCSGFSRAFKLLCEHNKIPCVLVAGIGITQGERGEHMWCLVQMEDGLWYAVDTTWDDYGGTEYMLAGGDTVSAFSGIKYKESHLPSTDFTGCGYEPFVYPTLSERGYLSVENW